MANEITPKKPIWKKWWLWLIIVFVVVIIIIASAGGEKKETKPEVTPFPQVTQEETLEELQEEYFINFDINLEGRNFTLEGDTNIPNGSKLLLGVHRYVEYWDEMSQAPLEGKRVVDLVNDRLIVQDHKFSYSTYLTDKKWYEKDLAENKALGLKLTKIYEDCYVSLTFTPARNLQPKEVYKILGNKFEKMKGKQVEKSGVGNVIQVSKDFKLPVEAGITPQ